MQAKVLSYLAKLKEKQIRSPTIVTHICIIYLASLQAEAGPAEDFEVTCQSWGGATIGVGRRFEHPNQIRFCHRWVIEQLSSS